MYTFFFRQLILKYGLCGFLLLVFFFRIFTFKRSPHPGMYPDMPPRPKPGAGNQNGAAVQASGKEEQQEQQQQQETIGDIRIDYPYHPNSVLVRALFKIFSFFK